MQGISLLHVKTIQMNIKNIFLTFSFLLLWGCSTNSQYQIKRNWTLYSSSDLLGSKTYIDYSNIEIKGNLRSFWSLTNFSLPVKNVYNDKKYISTLSNDSVDCSKKSLAQVSYYHFTEAFAAGELIYQQEKDTNQLNFEKAKPKSGLEETIIKICSL